MEDLDPGDVQFDDESGEGDSLVVERERDLALSAQARQTIADIDAALQRIKDGTYGFSVGVRQGHPEGAAAGHPVGDRAGRGEGRRARHSPVSASPRPVTDAVRVVAAHGCITVAVAAVVVVVDQLTKAWAVERPRRPRHRRRLDPAVPPTFNGGMAFSQGEASARSSACWPSSWSSCCWSSLRRSGGSTLRGRRRRPRRRRRRRQHPRPPVPLRRRRSSAGEVVDFIDLQWWPVFNVADAAIVVGGILLLLVVVVPVRAVRADA